MQKRSCFIKKNDRLIKMVFEIDEQGLIQGSCKFYENEILVADVNHKNGVVEGNVLNCYPTGELYSETNYVNGKKDGIETLYDKKGNRIAELTYSNDLLNGAMMLFFSNGRMAEKTYYKDGRKNGIHLEYASNGVVLKIANYENDLLEGVLEEFEFNGRLARKENYYHGRKNGPYVSYHENGQLLKKCFYRDDILSGPYEEYFVNGVLFKKGICVDGQLYSIEDYEKLKKQEREKLNLKLMTLNGWKRPTQERKMVKRQLVEEYRLNFPKTR